MWVFPGFRLDGTRHKDGPDAKPDKKNDSVKIFLLVPGKCGKSVTPLGPDLLKKDL
jgi:hypothetical protein